MNIIASRRIDASAGAPRIARHAPPLDDQIAAAEMAAVERDRHVQRRARQVADRLVDRWPLTLGLTLVAGVLLGRLLSPRRSQDNPDNPARRSPRATGDVPAPEAPIWRVLPLLWTLAPYRLRAKLPSGTVALLTNVVATLFGGARPRPRT